MPNSISGVSSAALDRATFRLLPGEWYILSATATEELYLDKLGIIDGHERLIVLFVRSYTPSVIDNMYLCNLQLFQGPDYLVKSVVGIYYLSASPLFTTSGGHDRQNLTSLFPYKLPYLGKLKLTLANCSGSAFLLFYSDRYKNRARYDLGGRAVLGGEIQAGYGLGAVDRKSYTDDTVGEVDKSKLDLGAVLSIKKFAARVAYMISGVVAGSSAKCYISEDDVEWTNIWEKVDLPAEETEEYIEVEDITARYIKFTLDANSVVEIATLHQYPLFAWVE